MPGISLKTQELYVLVFVTRYMDLLWNFASLYNWVMKVILTALRTLEILIQVQVLFIISSCGIVFIMRQGHKIGRLVVAHDAGSDCKVSRGDAFLKSSEPFVPQWPVWWLVAPCAVMGLGWHEYSAEHRLFEVC